jgi:hypothetical protein
MARRLLASLPLELPSLQILECNECENLQTIQVIGRKLKRFEAKKNPALKKVDLITLLCEVDLKESPQVKLDQFTAFGKAAWAKHFGDVGVEPPLPNDIVNILQSPCPFWPGKKVQETHLLVLIPQTVNGKPLTLEMVGELIQKPLQGTPTKYASFYLGQYTDPPAPSSHWALLTRDVIPGSRNKSYKDQQALVKSKASYEVPTILDATVAILMEHVRTGSKLYRDDLWTYTRCQEKYNDTWQLVVGGFGAGGLGVSGYGYVHDRDGVGGLRKFS